LALAATKEDQRIVVFGSEQFAADGVAQAQALGFAGGALVQYLVYPANTELFINTLHWLTQEADRISVGAQRSEIPRLDDLKDGFWLNFWQVFLVVVWPALALVVGGGVWFVRRR
jgi:hypothetical protein